MKALSVLLTLGLSALSVAGCATSLGPIEKMKVANACEPAAETPGIVLINRASASVKVPVAGQFAYVEEAAASAQWDDKHWYVRVNMGMRPSGGYRLNLMSEQLSVLKGVADFTLDWVAPPKDAMTAQVVNYPCINLALPKGDYTALEVKDMSGKVRHRLELPL